MDSGRREKPRKMCVGMKRQDRKGESTSRRRGGIGEHMTGKLTSVEGDREGGR